MEAKIRMIQTGARLMENPPVVAIWQDATHLFLCRNLLSPP
jgi:hypothetical protein